jgi:hypothetical protein
MSARELFTDLYDLAELVLLGGPVEDPLFVAWATAEADARAAYDAWRLDRERDSYVAYRACADRADAAQDALALRASRRGQVIA